MGQRLNAMLSTGVSKPWPDALEALTDMQQMDAIAIIDYFVSVFAWLNTRIAGKPVGWQHRVWLRSSR